MQCSTATDLPLGIMRSLLVSGVMTLTTQTCAHTRYALCAERQPKQHVSQRASHLLAMSDVLDSIFLLMA